jgi:hypothetical protein
LLDHERGRRLWASRTIICAWRTYTSRERFRLEKELLESKRCQDTIIALQMEQEKIRNRINSIDDEIEATRVAGIEAEKRRKELKRQFAEVTALMGVVESEDLLFNQADADAERSRLQLQLREVTDSIEACGDVIKSSRTNIDRLQMKQNTLYVNDLDRLCCLEHEEHEKQRRAELQRCITRKEREWRERVRFERMKWAVKLPKAKEEHVNIKSLDISYHRSVSTTRRKEILEDHTRKLNDEAQKKSNEAMLRRHQNGADNKVVRELFNRIIFRNMDSITKGG